MCEILACCYCGSDDIEIVDTGTFKYHCNVCGKYFREDEVLSQTKEDRQKMLYIQAQIPPRLRNVHPEKSCANCKNFIDEGRCKKYWFAGIVSQNTICDGYEEE